MTQVKESSRCAFNFSEKFLTRSGLIATNIPRPQKRLSSRCWKLGSVWMCQLPHVANWCRRWQVLGGDLVGYIMTPVGHHYVVTNDSTLANWKRKMWQSCHIDLSEKDVCNIGQWKVIAVQSKVSSHNSNRPFWHPQPAPLITLHNAHSYKDVLPHKMI